MFNNILSWKHSLFLVIFFLLLSCGQDFNSNSFDKTIYSPALIDTSTPEGQRLSDAYEILVEKCASCHKGYHNNYSGLITSQDWIDSGNIVKGNSSGSDLVIRLQNEGGNMPENGEIISTEDHQTIKDWIDQIP